MLNPLSYPEAPGLSMFVHRFYVWFLEWKQGTHGEILEKCRDYTDGEKWESRSLGGKVGSVGCKIYKENKGGVKKEEIKVW